MNAIISFNDYVAAAKRLREWANAYYNLDTPLTTDDEYDKLYKLVQEYESSLDVNLIDKNSPTRVVSTFKKSAFRKLKHEFKMYSLDNLFNVEQAITYLNKLPDYALIDIEPKLDGLSLSLTYNHGRLTKAITRGDGSIGDDVTLNAKEIDSIPNTISYQGYLVVEGEVAMHKSVFIALNKIREENKQQLFVNPRNAAAGSLKQLNPLTTKERMLTFYPWNVQGLKVEDLKDSHEAHMEFILQFGFVKVPYRHIMTVAKTKELINEIYEKETLSRNDHDVCLDGLVIKIDDFKLREQIGYLTKYSEWARAFKMPPIEKITTVLDVVMQTGRTGAITPVAILDPVYIDGSTVGRVTLHNFDEIKRLNLKLGDKVILIKSGDIIPKLIRVVESDPDNKDIKIPTHCEYCNSELYVDTVIIKCQNLNCSARIKNSLSYFASKSCANITGLGSSIVSELVDLNLISRISDIYKLNRTDLERIDGFGDKKINNLLEAIEASKKIRIDKFIASLGIELVGEINSKNIARMYGNDMVMYGFEDLTKELLLSVDGVGYLVADSFINFVNNNTEELDILFKTMNIASMQLVTTDSIFRNKNIVLTGTMSKNRDEIKEKLENLGAKISSSVSKTTDYLIYGEGQSSKHDKAIELNIKTIAENQLGDYIDGWI